MKTLEQLGFADWNHHTAVISPGIDDARLFPSLKKLDLRNCGYEWRDFLGKHFLEPTNTVEEVISPSTDLDLTTVVTASRLFPGLRKLEIDVNSAVVKAVCENMPNLEVLSLIGRDYYEGCSFNNFDYLITGMSLEVCTMFRGVMTETWMKKLKTAERRSLARLQNLKTLKLSSASSRLISFSRLSFHVFQQMSSLKCLDLNGSAYRQRSGRRYNDDEEKQFLADLREKFVVR